MWIVEINFSDRFECIQFVEANDFSSSLEKAGYKVLALIEIK
jgi:hypothetical protein